MDSLCLTIVGFNAFKLRQTTDKDNYHRNNQCGNSQRLTDSLAKNGTKYQQADIITALKQEAIDATALPELFATLDGLAYSVPHIHDYKD